MIFVKCVLVVMTIIFWMTLGIKIARLGEERSCKYNKTDVVVAFLMAIIFTFSVIEVFC